MKQWVKQLTQNETRGSRIRWICGSVYLLHFMFQILYRAQASRMVSLIEMGLFCIFVPGLMFAFGLDLEEKRRTADKETVKRWLLGQALTAEILYLAASMMLWFVVRDGALTASFFEYLFLGRIPSVSGVFLLLALTAVITYFGYDLWMKILESEKKQLLLFCICVLSGLLWIRLPIYPVYGALIGVEECGAIPVVSFFWFFIWGMLSYETLWLPEKLQKKIKGNLWIILILTGAVSAALFLGVYQKLEFAKHSALIPICLAPVTGMVILEKMLACAEKRWNCVHSSVRVLPYLYAAMAVAMTVFGKMKANTWFGAVKILVLYAGMYAGILGCILLYKAGAKLVAVISAFVSRTKHKMAAYFVIYTAIFGLFMLAGYVEFLIAGRSFVWRVDGLGLYYPRAIYYGNYVRDFFSSLLSGKPHLQMYDFRFGLGSEVTFSLEPMYLIFALFKEEQTELAYNLLNILHFYAAGITFSAFCFYFKKNYFPTMIGTILYVFCGFSFFAGTRHPMFMIPMIMLPLLIIAMEEILEERRWYLCTIFVAVSLFANYYFLYMNTVAMGIYCFARYFGTERKRSVKDFFAKAGTICGTYLIGVAMASIVLVTTFGLYVGADRQGSTGYQLMDMLYYSKAWIIRLIVGMFTVTPHPGEWLRLGFIPLAIIPLVLLFIRKGRKDMKWICFAGVCLLITPWFGYMFSGFDQITNRWAYMLALPVAFITVYFFEDLFRLTKRELAITGGAVGVYCALAVFGPYMISTETKVVSLIMICFFVIIFISQEKRRLISRAGTKLLLVLLCLGTVAFDGYSLFHTAGVAGEYAKTGASDTSLRGHSLGAVATMEDDSFYRVSATNQSSHTLSAPYVDDYNGVTMAFSVINGAIHDYLRKVGSPNFSAVRIFNLNNNTFVSSLAAVKYYSQFEGSDISQIPAGYEPVKELEWHDKNTTIYENRYALPIAYAYENRISTEELEAYPTEQRAEIMMQAVAIKDAQSTGADLTVSGKTVPYTYTADPELEFTDTVLSTHTWDEKDPPSVLLSFEGEANAETYIVFRNTHVSCDIESTTDMHLNFVYEDGSLETRFYKDTHNYRGGQEDYVVNLGYHEKPLRQVEIQQKNKGTVSFDELLVYSLPMNNLETYTDALKAAPFENIEVAENCVKGTIDLEKEETLVFSIPYQKGWTAYVDGVKTKVERANYMYCAVPLEAGHHAVEMRFAIPGVGLALCLIPCSVLLLVVLMWFSYRRKKKNQKSEISPNAFRKKAQ